MKIKFLLNINIFRQSEKIDTLRYTIHMYIDRDNMNFSLEVQEKEYGQY